MIRVNKNAQLLCKISKHHFPLEIFTKPHITLESKLLVVTLRCNKRHYVVRKTLKQETSETHFYRFETFFAIFTVAKLVDAEEIA